MALVSRTQNGYNAIYIIKSSLIAFNHVGEPLGKNCRLKKMNIVKIWGAHLMPFYSRFCIGGCSERGCTLCPKAPSSFPSCFPAAPAGLAVLGAFRNAIVSLTEV